MQFVQAKHYKRMATPRAITLVVIHSAEGPERPDSAERLARFFVDPHGPKGPVVASAHYNVDCDSITQSVREEDVAYHAGPVNGYSIGIEHAGYARQTREEWLDAYGLAMLDLSAKLVADICARHGIPIQRVTAEDLAAGRRSGICGHVDVTNGLTGGKGHWDPGPGFPWDWYLDRVRMHANGEHPTSPETPSSLKARVELPFGPADMQRALAQLGFDPGPIDGIVGPRTKAAIQAFQRSAGLTPDGIVGPLTQTALVARLRRADTLPELPACE